MKPLLPALSLSLALVACASTEPAPAPPEVPMALRTQPDESARMTIYATGSQVYECRVAATGPAWVFVEPQADLFDARGRRLGRHYAGPHWESDDGSKLVGAVRARSDAPKAGAIPWLLLSTKSVGTPGAFDGVSSIQRVDTNGGVAPQTACAQANAGERARVPYTAAYVLYGRAR